MRPVLLLAALDLAGALWLLWTARRPTGNRVSVIAVAMVLLGIAATISLLDHRAHRSRPPVVVIIDQGPTV